MTKRLSVIAPPQFLYRLFHDVMPTARAELMYWRRRAENIPDTELRVQALASLTDKRFHADGGCVYAAAKPESRILLVKIIVALQTISDYLDNLCDRCQRTDANDFRALHDAMRDAVRPGQAHQEYYRFRKSCDDGNYLDDLVSTCQNALEKLPGYAAVQPDVEWLVERYCELQETKHIEPHLREAALIAWSRPYLREFPEIEWWEFAAATGSTLGMFALFLAATEPLESDLANQVRAGYFPWLCGLHILLDYLIDVEEDIREGDFNFVLCYPSPRAARKRLRRFMKTSLWVSRRKPLENKIHQFVVKGLLGMYLSDRKALRQKGIRKAQWLLLQAGPTAWMFYWACLLYRIIR
ncbi:tetraprenyl-beta-curcumene synthase family protein [Alicyclobacillus tolerans]|uniref:Tetraprenyl-beta-curcumene synthase n=2 Tax=Alicyclobacillus tolerans TaxID=90970 RepID=A0ABT9LTK5_9BACL|nr:MULTISPECIES: tetraprenyl-beta-curcumene synthase family protein [Alicyclobacillus]MDP9727601.1 tetraprenyl-beta-curcumene synthase [Alicyclobacillus tengchongensis]SHJ64938.1 tetraprenyl-beta-curcumene synthase [Alicyclobacillus montanus]